MRLFRRVLALGSISKVGSAPENGCDTEHRGLIAAGHSIEWLMSRDRATPSPDPHPGLRERSYALQQACHGLQQHAEELRRAANRAVEESRHLRAEVKLLLSHGVDP